MSIKARTKSPFSAFLSTIVLNGGIPSPTIPVFPVADYYVSTAGNDSNSGLLLAPFRTHARAFAVATAGQTVASFAGVYVESARSVIKDGVNYIGRGSDNSGTVIISTYVNTFASGDPINHAWWALVSATDTHEVLGNNISGVKFIGALNVDTQIFVCNRSNVVFNNIKCYDFYLNAITFQGRKDYSLENPTATVSLKTFQFNENNKIIDGWFENCARWNGGNNLGTDGSGYGSGNIQRGGQKGFQLIRVTSLCKTRGRYAEGFPVKLHRNGHNFNEYFEDCFFSRTRDDQYFGFSVESWGLYGGNLCVRCTFEGDYDANNGKAGMAINPTSTYSLRFEDCVFGYDDTTQSVNRTYNVGGSVLSTSNKGNYGFELEAISDAGNFFMSTGNEMSDVEVESCIFRNCKAIHTFLHDASSSVRRVKLKNILYYKSATFSNGGNSAAVVDDITCENATIYHESPMYNIDGIDLTYNCQISNITYRNVIIHGTSRSAALAWRSNASATLTTVTFDNVVYSNNANSNQYYDVNSNSYSTNFASMVAVGFTGFSEINRRVQTVSFVNTATRNFNLTANILGVFVAGNTLDIENKTRDNPPTVGAYEYVV